MTTNVLLYGLLGYLLDTGLWEKVVLDLPDDLVEELDDWIAARPELDDRRFSEDTNEARA